MASIPLETGFLVALRPDEADGGDADMVDVAALSRRVREGGIESLLSEANRREAVEIRMAHATPVRASIAHEFTLLTTRHRRPRRPGMLDCARLAQWRDPRRWMAMTPRGCGAPRPRPNPYLLM